MNLIFLPFSICSSIKHKNAKHCLLRGLGIRRQWIKQTLQEHFITARVAKRAKVMFLQACVTSTPGGGGGVGGTPNATLDQVRMSTPRPPGTRSECLPPPPGPGQNVYPPPPGPGENVYYPPHTWDLVRTSTPPPRKLHAGGR